MFRLHYHVQSAELPLGVGLICTVSLVDLQSVCKTLVPLLYPVLQVSDLEREVKLKQLSLKELQKELDTEKALTSKLYDNVHLECSYTLVLSSSPTMFTFECNPASFSHPYHCFPHLHLTHSLPLLFLLLTSISGLLQWHFP